MPVCGADKAGQRQPVRTCLLRLDQTHTTVCEFERHSHQIAVETQLDLRYTCWCLRRSVQSVAHALDAEGE